MTNQKAFTTMVLHLRKQGCKSEDEEHQTCLYRGPNGLKCAVGPLITDEEYRPEWDEKGLSIRRIKHLIPSLEEVSIVLLEDMQNVHDHVQTLFWEEYFGCYAKKFHLTLPPMEATHA